MDSVFFHPKLVHLPIALGLLMPLITAGLAVAWWRRWLPARVWGLAVILQAILLGSGVVALRTGEAEEDRVEPVVAERFIEQHEEAAEAFVRASGAVLVVMLVAWAAAGRREALGVAAAAVAGTLFVLGLGYRAGQTGGALVYEHGAANAYVWGASPSSTMTNPLGHDRDGHDGDDDD